MPNGLRAAVALLQHQSAVPLGQLFASTVFLTASETYVPVHTDVNSFLFFIVLHLEPKVLCMLVNSSTTELCPQL